MMQAYAMSTPFGPVYAAHYDLFYRHKDYRAECDFLREIFQRFAGAQAQVRSVLDLGCGTGGHALTLAQDGFQVTGVDRSAAMIAEARQKVEQEEKAGGCLDFVVGDLRELDLGTTFDATIMMFAVLGYQVADEDLAAAFANVRRHLAPGGLFVADFWYGPAVLAQRPSNRLYERTEGDARLLRIANARLDVGRRTIEVRYKVQRSKTGIVEAETEESHAIRFLSPQELADFAQKAGLELVWLCPLLELDGAVDESTWSVTAVMRAIQA